MMGLLHVCACTSMQTFKTIMLKISQANVPLIHQVMPIIDYICTELDEIINDYSKLAIVWHAAQNAAMIIDKYYACTDESVMYWVAICTFFLVLQFHVLIVTVCMHVYVCGIHSFSPTSKVQGCLLQVKRIGTGVDCNSC